jgi:glycosyltransferase involved in cell wall biosynthesis
LHAVLPITLIVIAKNEAPVIGRCLDSVPFAAEKVVVDSGSTDGTPDIAELHGARVVHQEWLGFGPQRNFATGVAKHDWILVLDADEQLSPALAAELEQRLHSIMESSLAGAYFRRATRFMGRAMRWYRPMSGERIARLYHRERARWSDQRVHESLRFSGAVTSFRERLLHDHNPTLVHRHIKMLRYTELRAQDWRDRGRKVQMWLCPLVFVTTFLKDYLLRLAFLDGWRGYIVAQTAASYAVYKRLRYYEIDVDPSSSALASDLLRRHGLEP